MKKPKSFTKSIRSKCLMCAGTQTGVLFCQIVDCSLWPYRLGCSPEAAIKARGRKYEQIFNPENFLSGGKFAYPKTTPECLRVWE
jgi:hypothetical protein